VCRAAIHHASCRPCPDSQLLLLLALFCAYRWQSFYRGGSVAFYVALYAVGFLGSSLHNLSGFLPVLTYLSYMSIMILGLFTAMGTVGFLSSFLFVYKIFAAIKSE
jgi:transmembrane 9 superfamily protein 2/4